MPKITRSFRLNEDLIKRFDVAAAATGVDKTQIVTDAIIKFVEKFEMRTIKEFKLIELKNQNGTPYYSIRLDRGVYYAGYEETHIKTVNNIEFATRYLSEQNANSEISLIKTFFDKNGNRK
jgi:predicted DNA-binding protein